jgi:hypothetical protein
LECDRLAVLEPPWLAGVDLREVSAKGLALATDGDDAIEVRTRGDV